MIILCGDRRIVRDRYGYKIEVKHTLGDKSERAGEVVWKEDSPAFPASLSQALEMVFERTVADQSPEIDVRDLPDACQRAALAVRKYASAVRREGVRAAAAAAKERDDDDDV